MFEDLAWYAAIALAASVLLFLLLREFWCWYWKQTRIVRLLEQQNLLLARLLELTTGRELLGK
jgi:hypothetical protein